MNDIQILPNVTNLSMFAIIKGKTSNEADRLYAWGDNNYGQLGIGDRDNRSTPTQVLLPSEITKIAYIKMGATFTLLVLEDNSIWAAGINDYGQFGNEKFSSSTEYLTSFEKSTDFFVGKKITSFSVGKFHCAVIIDDSELYTWGRNNNGQLGIGSNGDATNTNNPVQVVATMDGLISEIGNIIEVMCGALSTYLKVLDSGKNRLYCWGYNYYGQLGFGNSENIFKPKLLENLLIDEFTNVYLGADSIFAYNDVTGILYGWGFNNSDKLGSGVTGNKTAPVEISVPFSEKITKMHSNDYATLILTESGKIYTVGSGTNGAACNGLGVDAITFTEIKDFPVVLDIVPAFRATIALTEDKMYAWGYNSNGQYGDGSRTFSSTPIQVDPFSTPSSLVQTKWDDTKLSYTVAKEIYSDAGVFNDNVFDEYVEKKGFFADTIYTMTSAPIVDGSRGTIKCTVQASKSYTQPDGAKAITDAPFDVTLTGFMVAPDSVIDVKTNIDTSTYNLTNIDNKLRPGNVLQPTVFTDLFTTTVFAAGNNFTSVTGGVSGNEYHVTIKADKAYVDGLIVSKDFELKIKGLTERPNSNPIEKLGQLWLKYQYDTIQTELGEGATTSQTKLIELYDFSSFPIGAIYTISNAGVTFDRTTRMGTYKADVTADKHYLDGNIDTNKKTYTITMDGFNVQVDSDITQKPDLDTKKYNLTNINNKLCPNGALDKGIFEELFITTNLPVDATLTSTGGTVNGDLFNITITTSKAWVDGFVKSANIDFILTVTGLQLRPDSTVIAKTPSPNELDDIISKLKPGEVIDKDTLGKLIDTSYFPEDTVFIIDTVNPNKDNSTIEFTFTPDKVYKDGNVIANTDATKVAFDANVKFEFPAEPFTENTGLIVGLSIGGILLLLIIIGLIIWYLKRRNKDSSKDNQSMLY